MNMIQKCAIALALAAGVSGVAMAAPIPGTGGGYYGSAWYDSGQGSVIAGATTWAECNNALQASINHAVSAWGWTVVTYNPCKYRPPFGQMLMEQEKVGIEIGGSSPGESIGTVRIITDEIVRVRNQYRADDFEAAMSTIYTSVGGK